MIQTLRAPGTIPTLTKAHQEGTQMQDTDTRREAQPNPSMAIIVVAHGKPLTLHLWASQFVADHIGSIGDELAWDEAYPDPIDGVWVCELRLADDGPSDWTPEIRECRLDASELRHPTPEEWTRLIAEEYVWDGEIPASQAGQP